MWPSNRALKNIRTSSVGIHHDPAQPDYDILLIHGAGNTADNMQPLLRALEFADVVALNLPGREDDSTVALDNIGALAAFTAGFISAADVIPWVLGHSLGAAIGLEVASKWPGLLSGLILVNASSSLPLNDAFMQRLQNDIPQTMRSFLGKAYGASASLVEAGVAMVCELRKDTVINDFKACRTYQALPYLKHIKLPVLILAGEDDIVTRLDEARELSANLENSKLVILPEVGHMGPSMAPEAIAREVNKFLTGN